MTEVSESAVDIFRTNIQELPGVFSQGEVDSNWKVTVAVERIDPNEDLKASNPFSEVIAYAQANANQIFAVGQCWSFDETLHQNHSPYLS